MRHDATILTPKRPTMMLEVCDLNRPTCAPCSPAGRASGHGRLREHTVFPPLFLTAARAGRWRPKPRGTLGRVEALAPSRPGDARLQARPSSSRKPDVAEGVKEGYNLAAETIDAKMGLDLTADYYSIGVYGVPATDMNVTANVAGVDLTWVAGSPAREGYNTYDGWDLKQTLASTTAKPDLDASQVADFGQWALPKTT